MGRETLIEIACRLLQELPPEKVTRIAIARASNVDPSLIRYYFRTRESLLVAAARRMSLEYQELLSERIAKTPDVPISRLRARITSLLDMHLRYPFFNRLLVEHVLYSQVPEAKVLAEEMTRRALEGYNDIISAGHMEGSFRKVDPVLLYVSILGMCEYFVSAKPILAFGQKRQYDHQKTAKKYATFICDLVLNGIADKGFAASEAKP